MDEKEQLALGGVKRSALAIVFYVIAGLIGLATLVFIGVSGGVAIATRSPMSGTIVALIPNAFLGALAFWAFGAVISYLHDTREYVRIIAQRLPEPSRRSEPSEN